MERHTYDWIRHHAEMSPDKMALVDLHSDRRLTYRQLDRRIDAVARFLRATVAPGESDCIAVLCHNSTDVLEIQFACRRLPARFLPLNWRFTAPELEFLLRDAKVKALFVGKEFEEVGRQAAAAAKLECVLSIADGGPSDFERGIEAGLRETPLEIPSLRENSVWTVMYTSGTTGHPKGALITYGMTDCLMGHLAAKVGMANSSVSLSVLPMFHISGLNTYPNPILYFGGTNYVMRTFDPALCLSMIANPGLGLTHFMGVPTHFLFMSQLPEFAHARFEHIESVISGGQAVPLPLIEEYASKGMYLQQGWGMTETCSLIFLLSKEDCISRRGSVGRPVMNVDIRIVDEELKDVQPGVVGELLLRGPQVAPGYLNRPDANRANWNQEWFRTGDAFRVDEDGFYYIVDRWKDMYISGGENVYPAEVERVLLQVDAILEAAVIGIPDPKWGEVGRAFIVLKEGAYASSSAILDYCRENLAKYKIPKQISFVSELPHTPSGKIMKHALKAAPYADQADNSVSEAVQ